jgi:branched-chain amino acid transport system substrate-binding protein
MLAAPSVSVAKEASSNDPVKIGLVQSLSGPFAPIGALGVNGAKLAAEGQTILGRQVQLVVEDDNSNGKVGAQKATKLINSDRVVAMAGMAASSIGLAVSNVASAAKIPLVLGGPSASELTGSQCRYSTFRAGKPPTYPMVHSVVPYLLSHDKAKRWYFIAYDYSWGHEGVKMTTDILDKQGAKIVGTDLVPVGTKDYSSFLLKVRRAEPSVLFVMLGGTDMAALINQFTAFGLQETTTLSGGVMDNSVAWQVGDKMTGVWPVPFYYKDPAVKEFTDAYMAKYNSVPGNQSWQDYMAVKSIITAMNAAGTTDFGPVIKQLENMKMDVKGMPGHYRAFDHQLVQPIYVIKTKAAEALRADKWDWGEIVAKVPTSTDSYDSLFGDAAMVGCNFSDK